MKRLLLLIGLVLLATTVFAQKKNGVVYIEHEYIDITKKQWKAFEDGNHEEFLDFFADSVIIIVNGAELKGGKKSMPMALKWWNGVENLKVEDEKGGFPDAIEYKNFGTWVQDWLRMTGVHKKTGIEINVHVHNLQRFNKDGKIVFVQQYFNNSFFEEIAKSQTKEENGKVYINHPHILTVRKMINAYVEKDIEKWASFFSTNSRLRNSTMKIGEHLSLEERKVNLKKIFSERGKFKMKQKGYPDCIYYAKDNNYVVYSWWTIIEERGNGEKYELPIMLQHDFYKNDKIEREVAYFSSNHIE